MIFQINGALTFFVNYFVLFLDWLYPVDCGLSMWGKIIFQCVGYDYTAYMDYMDPDILCPQKGW